MQKFVISLLALCSICISGMAFAEETYYISDDLITHTFAGPGTNYRITGSVSTGEKVKVIEVNQAAKYALISYGNNKQNWIPLDKLVPEPSIRNQVPILRELVQKLTKELDGINESWNKKTAEMQAKLAENETTIATLQAEKQQLETELEKLKKDMDDLSIQLDDKQRAIIQQWFLYGGAVAGGGLLFGLFISYLISRRKPKSRW